MYMYTDDTTNVNLSAHLFITQKFYLFGLWKILKVQGGGIKSLNFVCSYDLLLDNEKQQCATNALKL